MSLSYNSKFYLLLISILFFGNLYGQNEPDSTDAPYLQKNLSDIEVVGYLQPQLRSLTPTSIGILNQKEIELQSITSMVPALNTIPGVRMEERSPGSYRLSIRGSLVRSPYGIRNVKIYYNDFALTDAGGNTYLNVLNINDLQGVEILKGPDGSLFGANSGGVVLLKSNVGTSSALDINTYGGSYGLWGNSAYLFRNSGKHFWTVRQSYQRTDGYRQNTRNHRLFLQVSDKWQYSQRNFLEAYLFYSDLDYRTPGGLTEEQYNENPKQARPPTATMPGSIEQKTRISTKMYFGGIRHKAELFPFLSHTLSAWANHVDFVYPFITNYEIRKEKNIGLRTYFTLSQPKSRYSDWQPSLNIGFEGQRLVTDAYNYDNNAGEKAAIQAYNDIVNIQYFGFIRGCIEWQKKLVVEAALSLNYNGYHFRDTTHIKNNFPSVLMPHVAINYKLSDPLSLRFTVSKGYSNPTTAEVRPSDNTVHKNLHAEKGWNIEAGTRLALLNGQLLLDASCFHYLLKDGIVSQTDSAGNTYFVNSGEIKQLGIEASSSYRIIPYNEGNTFIKSLQWNCSYTYSNYNYDKYIINDNNHSGNRVAGVPRTVLVNNMQLDFPANLNLFVQHTYTSRIALNDANDAFAKSYNLLSARLNYNPVGKSYLPSSIYLYLDNILNEKYSLGNDLNAFGKRYYNAAPTFNFQIGMKWKL